MTRGDAYVASGSEDGNIHFWDLVGGKEVHKLSGHSGVVCSLSFHPTENALLSTSVDGTVSICLLCMLYTGRAPTLDCHLPTFQRSLRRYG